ncbi:unnamed protein product [Rotaria magnacalcarata]|uniref:Angiotensin-converting enzyme n=1 Tax=Rotaria magnacalcarata TaxID=392030 RepID=A0A8S3J1Y8_9BILA|nr:unnamed protein product [Rotaria magnacalcarata]
MFKEAESYFTSIDLYAMTPKFWARSLFIKPTDRAVVCHAGSIDMEYYDDYRIKMCAEINNDYYCTIHHEMGHIEYYMSYDKRQPFAFQDGANSKLLEIQLQYLQLIRLGFLEQTAVHRHYQINFLLRLALEKVAFLPFSYVMDKYRFLLFPNQSDRQNELNSVWWDLHIKY